MAATIFKNCFGASFFAAVVALCFLSFEQTLSGVQTDARLSEKQKKAIDAAVSRELQEQVIAGAAIGVILDGKIVYVKAYGSSNLADNTPATTKTVFNYASNSKPVLAILAMQLVEKGKLGLDEDIRKYVPEFPAKEKGVITTRQLLCHQSGIVHYVNGKVVESNEKWKNGRDIDPMLSINRFAASPLIFKPTEKISYSSHAYILLSAVVQRAGGMPIADQISNRITKPLSMSSFQLDLPLDPSDKKQELWTTGYRKSRGGELVAVRDFAHYWKHGAGGYKSDIEDFSRWAAALVNGHLVNKKTESIMWTAQKTADGKTTAYGLGFGVSNRNGVLKVSHGGSQDETKTRLIVYPKSKSGVVVMCNTNHANPGKISTAVYSALRE